MEDLENPFTSKDLDQIKIDLERIDAAVRGAEKARGAGFDVGDVLKRLNATRAKLQAVRQTYFPNQ